MVIYHNPRCSKSRQTLELLEDSKKDFDIILYLKEPPTKTELEDILSKLHIPAEKLVRKSEQIYKDNFKGNTYTEEEWVDILVANPKLIERPIVVNGNEARIGRPPESILEII